MLKKNHCTINNRIYTDLDVRPDLLTAEERARFPQVLSNEDRRSILAVTRLRMDKTDYDGHPILSPDEWVDAYTRYIKDFNEEQFLPSLCDTISRDVVVPENGKVMKADAGLADIVQRMMDRGLVIDTVHTRSGMVTDHSGMRWMPGETADGAHFRYPAGTHIYANYESDRPRIVFPADNTARHYNDGSAVEAVREAARLSDLHVVPYVDHARAQKALAVELPYLMDGTSYDTFIKEARQHAETHTEARFRTDRQAWVTQMNNSKLHVAESHGGVALYSDDMILDRMSRFERAVQRLMVSERHMTRGGTDEYNYADFLTSGQDDHIERESVKRLQDLWTERCLQYVYQRYKDTPERVDEVARKAGYTNYIAYITEKRSNDKTSAKRWVDFQKFEKEDLHQDHEGMLKLFRINNGINRDVNSWAKEERRKLAAPVIQSYRNAGYPVDSIKDFALLTDAGGKTRLVGSLAGKTMSCEVSPDTMGRLTLNAVTPFEAALETAADFLGWKGRLIVPVCRETVSYLLLDEVDGSGIYPLKHGDRVYKVNDTIWQQAVAVSRFERIPEQLRKAVFECSLPVKNYIFSYSPDEILKRVNAVLETVDKAVTHSEVVSLKDGGIGTRCSIGGVPQGIDKFSLKEVTARLPLSVDVPVLLAKELLASRHADVIFNLDRPNSIRR